MTYYTNKTRIKAIILVARAHLPVLSLLDEYLRRTIFPRCANKSQDLWYRGNHVWMRGYRENELLVSTDSPV